MPKQTPTKPATAKTKEKLGRPTVMTPEVIAKLEMAFLYGCTDLEACRYADITKNTLYAYQEKNPDFLNRKELLKEDITLRARMAVVQEIDNKQNVKRGSLALDYLKAKKSNEFAPRNTLDLAVSEELRDSMDKTKKMFEKVMGDKFAKAKKK